VRFSPFALVRLVLFGFAALTALAVALGRMTTESAEGWSAKPVRYHAINWYLFQTDDPSPRFMDSETGQIVDIPLGKSGYHKYLSCSPWQDAHGQAHVVGLPGVFGTTTPDNDGFGHDIVLARYTFPEGRLLDQVPLESIIPTSAPCWFPDASPRILFGAADGRLYRLSFPGRRATSAEDSDDLLHPVPLVWDCPPPGKGKIWLTDPSWPAEPRLDGKVIVSLTFSGEIGPNAEPAGAQLWWLQLSPDRRAIQQAGRLIVPGLESSQRWPVISTSRDREIHLAYLARRRGEPGWRLRTATVQIDPVSGHPCAESSEPRDQQGEGLPVPPAFSADGRWVQITTKHGHAPVLVERFALACDAGGNRPTATIRLTGSDPAAAARVP